MKKPKRVVIKIGTNVICKPDGSVNNSVMERLVQQIAAIKKQKIDVAIVSSGAVGFGRDAFHCAENVKKCDIEKQEPILQKQFFSAIGQVKLMEKYFSLFLQQNFFCAQVLLTKIDFSKEHLPHLRACLENLLANHVVPILNENDPVTIEQLLLVPAFAENDELAGRVAQLIGADWVVILTVVDGIFNGDPESPKAKLLREISPEQDLQEFVNEKKSILGRGGIGVKISVAQNLAEQGIETFVIGGTDPANLEKIFAGESVGTHFLARKA